VYEIEPFLYESVRDATSKAILDLCMRCIRLKMGAANAEISAWRILYDHPALASRENTDLLCEEYRATTVCFQGPGSAACAACPSRFDAACLLTLKMLDDFVLTGPRVLARLRALSGSEDENVRTDAERILRRVQAREDEAAHACESLMGEREDAEKRGGGKKKRGKSSKRRKRDRERRRHRRMQAQLQEMPAGERRRARRDAAARIQRAWRDAAARSDLPAALLRVFFRVRRRRAAARTIAAFARRRRRERRRGEGAAKGAAPSSPDSVACVPRAFERAIVNPWDGSVHVLSPTLGWGGAR